MQGETKKKRARERENATTKHLSYEERINQHTLSSYLALTVTIEYIYIYQRRKVKCRNNGTRTKFSMGFSLSLSFVDALLVPNDV